MSRKRHLLVLDPTAFSGGSKVATENILRQLDRENVRMSVLTADDKSWSWTRLQHVRLLESRWLAKQVHGIAYFVRHLLIAIQIIIMRYQMGRFDIALGASGPGVDLALYLAKPFMGYKIVQLVHGDVACSRTVGRCLLLADEIHYLESTKNSLEQALRRVSEVAPELIAPSYQIMQNGIPANAWPKRCQMQRPVIFWAASLLKWKGLETLLGALSLLRADERNETHICYMRPKDTALAVSQAPIEMKSVFWYESPNNMDRIRSAANIFISTSEKEPFGLSILEAMAAGHCIVIPADGAYWDRHLEADVECIKYQANNTAELADKLFLLTHNMPLVRKLGNAAAVTAKGYRAERCYASIKNSLIGCSNKASDNTTMKKEPD